MLKSWRHRLVVGLLGAGLAMLVACDDSSSDQDPGVGAGGSGGGAPGGTGGSGPGGTGGAAGGTGGAAGGTAGAGGETGGAGGTGGFGAEVNPTGNPIGGGTGYTFMVCGNGATPAYTVTTKAELLSALSNATAGEVICVTSNADIDMTGTPSTTIPAGVTLASDRGLNGSPGGLIKRKENLDGGWEEPMFVAGGDDVRVTGLQLEGEMKPQDDVSVDESLYLVGIFAEERSGFEVDNCEMRGWSWSCVSLRHDTDAHIHHNYIHHNQARGEGYGTNLYGGSALIEANLYDYNRHDVTGAGMLGEFYEARYNHILGHGNAIGACHFDVHQDEEDGTGAAGDTFLIHHNTVDNAPDPTVVSVHIRARPATGCYVDHNVFNNIGLDTGVPNGYPIYQTNSDENLFATNNMWMGVLYPDNEGIVWYQ